MSGNQELGQITGAQITVRRAAQLANICDSKHMLIHLDIG